jgi:pyruvate-formate lyase-activating enzyme
MSSLEIIRASEALSNTEKIDVMRHWIASMNGDIAAHRKAIERLLRRIEHPEVPEEVLKGFEECEDGETFDLDEVLNEPDDANGA